MPLYEVLSASLVVGHTDLETGDPPMGCAFGKFIPTADYAAIQRDAIAARETSQRHLALEIRNLARALILPAQGGVQIVDFSTELGADGLEVHVLGIPYPLYSELFPSHVAAYRALFS